MLAEPLNNEYQKGEIEKCLIQSKLDFNCLSKRRTEGRNLHVGIFSFFRHPPTLYYRKNDSTFTLAPLFIYALFARSRRLCHFLQVQLMASAAKINVNERYPSVGTTVFYTSFNGCFRVQFNVRYRMIALCLLFFWHSDIFLVESEMTEPRFATVCHSAFLDEIGNSFAKLRLHVLHPHIDGLRLRIILGTTMKPYVNSNGGATLCLKIELYWYQRGKFSTAVPS